VTNLAKQARDHVATNYETAVVVTRDRRQILHDVGNGRFALWSHVSPIHIDGTDTEIDTAWVPAIAPAVQEMVLADYNAQLLRNDFANAQLIKYIDPGSGEEITFQPQQLEWVNDTGQLSTIANPSGANVQIDDDTLFWPGAFGVGLDFKWITQTIRLSKLLIINNLAALGTPPQFILDGGNPKLKLQFIFQKSSGVTIWVDGVAWDEKGNNPLQTADRVEFKDDADNTLWFFSPPVASDNAIADDSESEIPATYHFRKSGNSLFVEVRVPWAWLETAVYPVEVDPTVNPQVAAGADDADEDHVGGNFDASGSPLNATAHTSSSGNRRYFAGFRVQVNASGTVNDAYATIVASNTTFDDPNVDLSLEDVDDSADFSTTPDVTSRARTAATTQWTATGIGTGSVNTPSITTSVQEVFDRGGWASGQYITTFLDGRGDVTRGFRIISYEGSSSNAAKLFIDYTESGGVIVPVVYHHRQRN